MALRLTTVYPLFFRRSKEPGTWDRPFTPLLSRLGMRGVLSPLFPTYFKVFDTGTSPLLGIIQDTQKWKDVDISLVHPWLVQALLRIVCSIDHNRLTTQLTQLAAGCTEEKACFGTHSQNLMMWNDNNQVTVVSHQLEILEHSIYTHVLTKCHPCAVLNRFNSLLWTTSKRNITRRNLSTCTKIMILPKFRICYSTINYTQTKWTQKEGKMIWTCSTHWETDVHTNVDRNT
jgi:hypothetical protein